MQEIQIKRFRHGIWIDNEWLRKAGLGDRLEIELKENEILIRSADKAQNLGAASSENGWDVFRKLGDDAVDGCLENASENHDRYLYGEKE